MLMMPTCTSARNASRSSLVIISDILPSVLDGNHFWIRISWNCPGLTGDAASSQRLYSTASCANVSLTHDAHTNRGFELDLFCVLFGYTRHRLLHCDSLTCQRLRICEVRAACPIRWLWRVLHNQFDVSSHALASPVPRHRDTKIDTRCDATTGEPIAVDADALTAGLRAELCQSFPRAPVHRSTV